MSIGKRIELLHGEHYFQQNFPVFVNRTKENFVFPEHSHDFMEIAYVAEGKGFHYIDGKTIPVARGDTFYIPVGTPHVFRPASLTSPSLAVYNCLFSPALLDRIVASCPVLLPNESVDGLSALQTCEEPFMVQLRSSAIIPIMDQLYQEYNAHPQREARELMLILYIAQLLVLLSRSLYAKEVPARNRRSDSRLETALRLIRENLANPLPLSAISAHVNIGKRQFHRLISKATGQTYSKYIQTLQIEYSCELLRDTDDKIYEIAGRCGVPNLKRFHHLFRTMAGMSPLQYRKQSRQHGTQPSLLENSTSSFWKKL